jgi:hypothetical protein
MHAITKNILSKSNRKIPITKITARAVRHVKSYEIDFVQTRILGKSSCCSSKYIEISCGICDIKITFKSGVNAEYFWVTVISHNHDSHERPVLLLEENKDYKSLETLKDIKDYKGGLYCGLCMNKVESEIIGRMSMRNNYRFIQQCALLLEIHLRAGCKGLDQEKDRFADEYKKIGKSLEEILIERITGKKEFIKNVRNETIDSLFRKNICMGSLVRIENCTCKDSYIAVCELCGVTQTIFDEPQLRLFYSSCVKKHFGKTQIKFSHEDFVLPVSRKLGDYIVSGDGEEGDGELHFKTFSYTDDGYVCAICGKEYESKACQYPPIEVVLLHFENCVKNNSCEYIKSALMCI